MIFKKCLTHTEQCLQRQTKNVAHHPVSEGLSCNPALFTVAKICEQPKCPSVDDWIKKMSYVCVYIYKTQNITQP